MPGAHTGQKRVQNALEMEIKMVVTYHVDYENKTQVLCENNKRSELPSLLSSPIHWGYHLGKRQTVICPRVPAIYLDFNFRILENT